MMKSRGMGWAYNMHGKDEMHTKFWSDNLKGGYHLEDLVVDGRITLDWILGK
jgi:hypothetical protein